MANYLNDDFYNSKQWRKKAASVLSRYNYVDAYERRYGRMVDATIVHHILPLEHYPELAYQDFNLMPVSKKTHMLLHRQDGSLSKKGLEIAERTARQHNIDLGRIESSGKNYRSKNLYAKK